VANYAAQATIDEVAAQEIAAIPYLRPGEQPLELRKKRGEAK